MPNNNNNSGGSGGKKEQADPSAQRITSFFVAEKREATNSSNNGKKSEVNITSIMRAETVALSSSSPPFKKQRDGEGGVAAVAGGRGSFGGPGRGAWGGGGGGGGAAAASSSSSSSPSSRPLSAAAGGGGGGGRGRGSWGGAGRGAWGGGAAGRGVATAAATAAAASSSSSSSSSKPSSSSSPSTTGGGGGTKDEPATWWNEDYVRMPCSKFNTTKGGGPKWREIEDAISRPISSSQQLENCILSYNRGYAKEWDLSGLRSYCDDYLEENERKSLFSSTLPSIAALAKRLPSLAGEEGVRLLLQGEEGRVELSQVLVASLMANAFFCTFPRRNMIKKREGLPSINFNTLYSRHERNPNHAACSPCQASKLHCIFHYFHRLASDGFASPPTKIIFVRNRVSEAVIPSWNSSNSTLPKLTVETQGCIEDSPSPIVQVDFANKVIGGGVLGHGSVQEEIRFIISPELIISRLLFETMADDECIWIKGSERFCQYSGYSSSFTFEGPHIDLTPIQDGVRQCTILAIDARHFGGRGSLYNSPPAQFRPGAIRRDLIKAYCGFRAVSRTPGTVVATGNWGCGVYGGNIALKAVMQLIAAAEAKCDVIYFTFGDEVVAEKLKRMYAVLKKKNVTVRQLWEWTLIFASKITGEDISRTRSEKELEGDTEVVEESTPPPPDSSDSPRAHEESEEAGKNGWRC